MILYIHNVIDRAHLQAIFEKVQADPEAFGEGRKTAGWHAKAVKNNEQAQGAAAQAISDMIAKTLLAHPVFRAAAMPKQFVKILLSRYRPGMAYGTHVDDALMGGVRTDLSFTLFLADPASYEGGALIVEGNDGDTDVKLPAGSLVLYPATSLHRVDPVTRGERLAVAGWVRSYIRSHEDREILFDLENTIVALRETKVNRAIMDRLFKVRANLIRKWAED